MENQQQQDMPSFLVIIQPEDLTGKLMIPDSLLGQHGDYLSMNLALVPRYGNPQVVSVEKYRRGCSFTSGWADFVEDNAVEEDDFVVFNFRGPETADVLVYDAFGCVKSAEVNDGADKNEEEETGEEGKQVNKENRIITFEATFKNYMKTYMYTPIELARMAKLSPRKKATVKDPRGEVWSIGICAGDLHGVQMRLTTGWAKLVRANRLEVGDRMEFCYNSGERFIEMKIYKAERVVVVID
ncbi:B3 domain-containing protein At4g01580 [Linum grandiflorum]